MLVRVLVAIYIANSFFFSQVHADIPTFDATSDACDNYTLDPKSRPMRKRIGEYKSEHILEWHLLLEFFNTFTKVECRLFIAAWASNGEDKKVHLGATGQEYPAG